MSVQFVHWVFGANQHRATSLCFLSEHTSEHNGTRTRRLENSSVISSMSRRAVPVLSPSNTTVNQSFLAIVMFKQPLPQKYLVFVEVANPYSVACTSSSSPTATCSPPFIHISSLAIAFSS